MTDRLPCLLVGDGPHEPTGLGRIARDLAAHLATTDLPIAFVQIGGSVLPFWRAWEWYPLERGEDWGASWVQAIYQQRFGDRPGILFTVWDPGRLLPYAQLDLPVQKWAYTAVDAGNREDRLSGPAAAALQQFDRVLGYGRWGAEILKRTLGQPIPYLPHGIQTEVWANGTNPERAAEIIGPYRRKGQVLLGSVMTNQFRKDHAIFCATLRGLLDEGVDVFGWLHTDVAVKAWSLPQLVSDFGLQKHLRITAGGLTDGDLAAMYHACDVVVLPTLGEGFGYPIVEALASGTPVVHGDCAGGAELVPKTEWRVPVRTTRLEGIYALKRPVWEAQDWVNAVRRVLDWRQAVGAETVGAYCRGAVAHLDWRALWPRWESWIREGIEG